MMLTRNIFVLAMMLCSLEGRSQNVIPWSADYKLNISDFQGAGSKIGNVTSYSLQGGSVVDFYFAMSNAEFAFTKNFNSKVNVDFNRTAATLVASDSAMAIDLVAFAQYDFNLTELYARKFRKRLNEEKSLGSRMDFARPIYDQLIAEQNERRAAAITSTDLGKKRDILATLDTEVRDEIKMLPDYCKSCVPPKRKKNKK